MLKQIKRAVRKPGKAFRYLRIAARQRIGRKKGVLVYIGADPQGEFNIVYPGYKSCYCFEANPERYEILKRKFSRFENVKIFNYAVSDYDGEIEFNISSNDNGDSSSIGNFNKEWLKTQEPDEIRMNRRIKIPCINLLNFCRENNIDYIDDYISDIQGMDLQVLKTLRPMIENKRIGSIVCEVTKDEYGNIYEDLPDNSESGFHELLNDHYELVAKGLGILVDDKFDAIPEERWEMDCKWIAKT